MFGFSSTYSSLHFQSQPVIRRVRQILLCAKIPLRSLDARMSPQQLDLFQFAARLAAQLYAGAARILSPSFAPSFCPYPDTTSRIAWGDIDMSTICPCPAHGPQDALLLIPVGGLPDMACFTHAVGAQSSGVHHKPCSTFVKHSQSY
jgi:hypothetical protein